MFLIFNKEFRQIESILSDLMTKVKKSAEFVRKVEGRYEIYELDTVDIYFQISSSIITIKDKSGKEIISLDCHYDMHDKLQNAKWGQFGSLLKAVRDAYTKRLEKAEKREKFAQKIAEELVKEELRNEERAAKQKMLSDALGKLRGM